MVRAAANEIRSRFEGGWRAVTDDEENYVYAIALQ